MLLIVNGKLCEKHPLELHNRSFRYGDGLFEQLKLFNGKIFNSSHHLSRLEFSLKHLQLHLPCNVKEVFDQVEFLAQKNMDCNFLNWISFYIDFGLSFF